MEEKQNNLKNNKPLFVDIDGVIRDIATPIFGRYVNHYYISLPNCFNLLKYAVKNIKNVLDFLKYAPPTEYLEIIRNLYNSENIIMYFASFSLFKKQKELTYEWLEKNGFNLNHLIIFWTKSPKEKLKIIKEYNGILLDDYPFKEAQHNSNIFLVNRPYNKKIKAINRIYSPSDIVNILLCNANIR